MNAVFGAHSFFFAAAAVVISAAKKVFGTFFGRLSSARMINFFLSQRIKATHKKRMCMSIDRRKEVTQDAGGEPRATSPPPPLTHGGRKKSILDECVAMVADGGLIQSTLALNIRG